MSSVHRFFVLLLISCLVFGIAPSALAADVSCGDTITDARIKTADEVHDYLIDLVSGSLVTIDVDAEEINSTLDTALEVQDFAGQTLFFVDDFTPESGEVSLDPYLEFTVDTGGIHHVIVSAVTKGGTGSFTDDSYTISFECSEPAEPAPPIEPGDLLASTGSVPGSLISIVPETGASKPRYPLGQFGTLADIEFSISGDLFGTTIPTNGFNGAIIIINPDTGEEVLVGEHPPGEVRALEFVDGTLYGFFLDAINVSSKLVTIDQSDGTFISEFSVDFTLVEDLASDPLNNNVMYGVALGSSGSELFAIDIDTGLLAATSRDNVPITGLDDVRKEQVKAIEFDQNGTLFGVARGEDGAENLVTIVPATGEATVVGSIVLSTVSTTSSLTADSPAVSGLAFVPGDEDQTYAQTLCSSTLASSKFIKSKLHRKVGQPAVRLFKFQGTQAELLTIKLTLEESEPAVESADEVVANVDSKNKAFLGLRHTSWWVDFRKRTKGPLPLEIVAELPEDGWYRMVVIQPMRRHLRTNYCLTVESQDPNSVALETLDVAQPGDLWSQETTLTSEEAVSVEPQTVSTSDSDSTKITASASMEATSVESAGTTVVEPAEDGTEVSADDGRTEEVDDDSGTAEGNIVNTEDPVNQDDGPAVDGRTAEVDDDSDTAAGNTVNTEDSVEPDDGPAADGRTEEVVDDSGTAEGNTVNTEDPVNQDDGPAVDDGRTAEVDDDSDTAEGSTVNTEDLVEPDDGPAVDDGRTAEVDDDSGTAAGSTVSTEESLDPEEFPS